MHEGFIENLLRLYELLILISFAKYCIMIWITDTYFFRQILYYDFDKNGFIGSKFHVVILFEMS